MATSPNIALDLPARGSHVGVWDAPVNGDFTLIDQAFGTVTTIALTSANVTLATSQAQSAVIKLTGTLNADVLITLASIYKSWTFDNQITNSPSSYCVVLTSTSATNSIGLPQGAQDVYYDGTNVRYKNLGKLGELWDYAGGSVPRWVTTSTVPPYLNCDGSAFSSATYPQLANLIGATTLPDARGRTRYALNQGTGRLTTAGAGIDGNNNLSVGGNNGITLGSSQIPTLTSSGTVTVYPAGSSANYHWYSNSNNFITRSVVQGVDVYVMATNTATLASSNSYSGGNTMTYTNSSQAIVQATTPGYVMGITMIKATP